MKKFNLLLLSVFILTSIQAKTEYIVQTLFPVNSTTTYTSAQSAGGLSFTPGTASNITVLRASNSKATVDSKYSGLNNLLRLESAGNPSSGTMIPTQRYASITVTGKCNITVYGMAGNAGQSSTLNITDGTNKLGTLVDDESKAILYKKTVSYDGEGGTIYFYLEEGRYTNFYIGAIIVEDYDSSGTSSTSFDFESGNINGWTKMNEGAGISITQEDKHGGSYAVKLVSGSSSSNAWDLQLKSPEATVISGHRYKISFWAKAVGGGGKIRISTAAAGQISVNGNPEQYLPSMDISADWAEYSYEVVYGGDVVALGTALQLNFDMGTVADKTYYLDDVAIVDLDGGGTTPEPSTSTFDFESGNINGWTKMNEGAGISITQEDKHGGSYAVKLVSGSSSSNAWDLQFQSPSVTTVAGHRYKISFWAKAVGGGGKIRISTAAAGQISVKGEPEQYLPDMDITADWAEYSYEIVYGGDVVALGTALQLNFDMGTVADKTYYLDDVTITDLDGGGTTPPNPASIIFDFDSGDLSGWEQSSTGGSAEITTEDKHSGSYAVKLIAPSTGNYWSLQFQNTVAVVPGDRYKISFWAKAVGGGGTIRISTAADQLLVAGSSSQYLPDRAISADWAEYTYEIVYGGDVVAVGSELQLNFDMGVVANKTYYLDDITITNLDGRTTGIIETEENDNLIYYHNNQIKTVDGVFVDMQVFDLNGRLVLSQSNVSELDLFGLKSGLYIVKASHLDVNQIIKIVK